MGRPFRSPATNQSTKPSTTCRQLHSTPSVSNYYLFWLFIMFIDDDMNLEKYMFRFHKRYHEFKHSKWRSQWLIIWNEFFLHTNGGSMAPVDTIGGGLHGPGGPCWLIHQSEIVFDSCQESMVTQRKTRLETSLKSSVTVRTSRFPEFGNFFSEWNSAARHKIGKQRAARWLNEWSGPVSTKKGPFLCAKWW